MYADGGFFERKLDNSFRRFQEVYLQPALLDRGEVCRGRAVVGRTCDISIFAAEHCFTASALRDMLGEVNLVFARIILLKCSSFIIKSFV